MAVKKPSIDIVFKQKATNLIDKPERGIAILILKNDTTTDSPSYAEYYELIDFEKVKNKYSDSNQQAIKDVLGFSPYKLIVVNFETVTESLEEIEKRVSTGWITIAYGSSSDFEILSSWIKTKESRKETYKAITYKKAGINCKHVANNSNNKVVFNDSRGEVDAIQYLPSLLGIAAYCGGNNKSMTYFKCSNLKSVEGFSDIDEELAKGNLVMFNDNNCVRICQGINTLTTLDDENDTEDMQFIETIECMDMIQDAIRDAYKESYIGKKNKYDNQVLLISAIDGFFSVLEEKDYLDSEYDNTVSIDVESQRQAWISSGKEEAKNWNEAKVKINTFKRDVYLKGDIKILGSMTNLKFDISLF